jgi:F-type H+-transporting ATPase subunit c
LGWPFIRTDVGRPGGCARNSKEYRSVNKFLSLLAFCWAVLLVTSPALAQGADGFSMNFGPAFGAGLVILGAGWGIGKIGGAAVEGMSRQPEAANNIQTAMIISAALIEGATFFALIVCMLFNWPG